MKAERPIENGQTETLEVESDLARYDYCYSVKITYTTLDKDGKRVAESKSAMEGWLISDFFFEDGEFANDLVRSKILDLIAETRNPKSKTE